MSTRSCGEAPPSPMRTSVTYETPLRSPVIVSPCLDKLSKRVYKTLKESLLEGDPMTTMQSPGTFDRLGELIRPGDAAYDEARRVWNAMFDCRPAAIARVQGALDVIAVVSFARETGA